MKAVMRPQGSPAAQPRLAPRFVPMKMNNFTPVIEARIAPGMAGVDFCGETVNTGGHPGVLMSAYPISATL